MQIKASSPQAYLKALPPERRAVVAKLRTLIRRHLPKGYAEAVRFGMLSYEVPLRRFPDTYNKQPLMYVALAAQKNYYALYMMCLYGSRARMQAFEAAFKRAGKKLDMGKCCVRFKSLDDLPLEIIAETVASVPLEAYLKGYEAARKRAR